MNAVHCDIDTITNWLVDRVASELKIAPDSVPLNEAFFNIGLNSLNTLVISGELGEFLGSDDFSPSQFWDYPTIEKLAEHLAEQPQTAAGA